MKNKIAINPSLLGTFSPMVTPSSDFELFDGTVINLLDSPLLKNDMTAINSQNRRMDMPAPYNSVQQYIDSIFPKDTKISPLGVAFKGAVITIKTSDSKRERTPILTTEEDFGKFQSKHIVHNGDMVGFLPQKLVDYFQLSEGDNAKFCIGLSFQTGHSKDYKPVVVGMGL